MASFIMNNKTLIDEILKHYAVCETYFVQEVMSHQNMAAFLEEKNKIVKKIKDLHTNQPTPQMQTEVDKVD